MMKSFSIDTVCHNKGDVPTTLTFVNTPTRPTRWEATCWQCGEFWFENGTLDEVKAAWSARASES